MTTLFRLTTGRRPLPEGPLPLTDLPSRPKGIPHPGQVIGRGRQRHLHRHLLEPAPPKLPHAPLLFQRSEHRLDDRLAPLVDRPPAGAPQSLAQATMLRMMQTTGAASRSEEHTSELQSQSNLVCRLLLEKKKTNN